MNFTLKQFVVNEKNISLEIASQIIRGLQMSHAGDCCLQCRIYHRANWARAQGLRSRGPEIMRAKRKKETNYKAKHFHNIEQI